MQTTIPTTHALAVESWQEKLFRDWKKEAFFSRFTSSDGRSVVFEKRDQTKIKGTKMTFGLPVRIAGAGWKTGNATIEGLENAITFHNQSVELERYRVAVKDDGWLTRQRPIFELPDEQRFALVNEGAEKYDQLIFDAAFDTPTKISYAGAATSTATLAQADLLTPTLLSNARAWAITGGRRAQTPFRPIMVQGRPWMLALVHPETMNDLKKDSTFAQARREALERGPSNPIFTGAEAIWDGVIVFEHENVPVYANWGAASTVTGSKTLLLGQSAIIMAIGETPSIVEKDFDYDEFHGMCYRMSLKTVKAKFNSLDYATYEIRHARTAL